MRPNVFPMGPDDRGIIKATVLARGGLQIAVLNETTDNRRLCFALCQQCCELNDQAPLICGHSDKERSFTGQWYSEELRFALSEVDNNGKPYYEVTAYYEAWIWNPDKLRPLFRGMIEFWLEGIQIKKVIHFTFIAIFLEKFRCSGFPKNVTTPEAKQQYCDHLNDKYNFHLKPDEVAYNEAGRHTSKISINSIWGFWLIGLKRIKIIANN